MSSVSFLEKLLDGVDVEATPLEKVAEIKRGTSITKKDVTPGKIPVIAGGRTPAYFHSVSNRTGQTIVIAGSGAYAGFVSWWDQPIFVSDAFTVKPYSGLLPKYCFYWLHGMQQQLHELKSGGGVPHVYPRDVAPLQIPIPCPDNPKKSLEIQAEIVRILDSFTELTAELTARKKQYNYYRDKLLSFEDQEVEWKYLSEIAYFYNAKPHEKLVSPDGDMALITAGFISTEGRSVRYVRKDAVLTPALQGDVAMVMSDLPNGRALAKTFFVEESGRYAVNQRVCLLRVKEPTIFAPKFLHYVMNRNRQLLAYDSGVDQTHLKKDWILSVRVPAPPLVEQVRIVAILDKFDALTNSITEGLPHEIELRQKQYAYYRDLLFNFPKPETASAASA